MSASLNLDWKQIQTVLLDMDGTLLDLHFDDYFWREHVPRRYAEKHSQPLAEVQAELFELYRQKEGTIEWYCVDYWSETLGLDIPLLKEEVDHLIAVHPHVVQFLDLIKLKGKRRVLVTNAHGKSLALKMKRTQLGGHLDSLVCAHDLGLPKEDIRFWDLLKQVEPFDPTSTLLVDDSHPVLNSARKYGIRFLVGVLKPNSRGASKEMDDFALISDFSDLFPPEE